MVRTPASWIIPGLALALSAGEAGACSRASPDASLGMSAEELDQDAQRALEGATAVVEAIVIRRPFLRPSHGPTPPPGLLRVDHVLSGNAPETVETRWHMCGYFDRVGERMTVVLHPRHGVTNVHPDLARAIRRRLRGE